MYNELKDKKANYYLKVSGIIFLLLLSIFVLVLSSSISRYLNSSVPLKTINVTGYAEQNIAPDIRQISINISAKAATEKEAQSLASTKSQKVSGVLKSKNIADADIKSQNLSTYPEYKNQTDCPTVKPMMPVSTGGASAGYTGAYAPCSQNSVIVGYSTNQTITVSLRGDSMNKAGELVAELTQDGVTVQTGEATVENPERLKADIQSQAISDARKNAEKLAASLGVKLGKVQSFNEQGGSPYPMMYDKVMSVGAMSREATPAPVISNGSEKVSSTVNVTFEIR